MTEYKLDMFWLNRHGYPESQPIIHLDDVVYDGSVKGMLCNTFPQFPKSHWECWWSGMRNAYNGCFVLGGTDHTGLYIRVHFHDKKPQGVWDYWRLWRPWREWSKLDDYNKAIRFAKGFKKEYERMKGERIE